MEYWNTGHPAGLVPVEYGLTTTAPFSLPQKSVTVSDIPSLQHSITPTFQHSITPTAGSYPISNREAVHLPPNSSGQAESQPLLFVPYHFPPTAKGQISFSKETGPMAFNLFDWIRDGVRRSVLLGVSDAVQQMGDPPAPEEVNQHMLDFFRHEAASPPKMVSRPKRKKLGRSLSDSQPPGEK